MKMALLLLLLLLSRFKHVRLCATPQMATHQAPPSLGFSRQEHWSGLKMALNVPYCQEMYHIGRENSRRLSGSRREKLNIQSKSHSVKETISSLPHMCTAIHGL